MAFKIGDKVKVKKWEDIDKSLYPLNSNYDDNKSFIFDINKKEIYEIIDKNTNSDDDDKYDCIIYNRLFKRERVFYFEIEKYIQVNLPNELFEI